MRINTIICLLAIASICMMQGTKAHGYLSLSNPDMASSAHLTGQNTFQWRGTVATGRIIEIKGVYGDINAEATSGSEVEVVATKQAGRSNPAEVKIRTLQHSDGVTICAVYPSSSGQPNTCQPGDGESHVHNNDVRVDFTVRVPAGVRLVARTVNGNVNAASLSSNVEAYSALGNIWISTTKYAQARTVTGSITATLGNANWSGQLQFESSTGEITLKLPTNANTELHAESITGDISSEFPLTVQGSVGSHNLNGIIGSGGRKLALKTVSGPIKVLRAT